jgi:hypothetical protein
MARRKTLPESVRAKLALAERLGTLRSELFGERGGPEMARRLGIPVRTWYNYEGGVTVPAEVVLKIIELTSVEPSWLLHGKGPKFRHGTTVRNDVVTPPVMKVGELLRTALQILESEGGPDQGSATEPAAAASSAIETLDASIPHGVTTAPALELGDEPGGLNRERAALEGGPDRRDVAYAGQRENPFIRISGNAMAPILADGASVAYSARDEDVTRLHKKLVVVWLNGTPVVRWFEHCGRYALLKAENPETIPAEVLLDLEDHRDPPRIRRVLWINTPH